MAIHSYGIWFHLSSTCNVLVHLLSIVHLTFTSRHDDDDDGKLSQNIFAPLNSFGSWTFFSSSILLFIFIFCGVLFHHCYYYCILLTVCVCVCLLSLIFALLEHFYTNFSHDSYIIWTAWMERSIRIHCFGSIWMNSYNGIIGREMHVKNWLIMESMIWYVKWYLVNVGMYHAKNVQTRKSEREIRCD